MSSTVNHASDATIDLDAYLARIGYLGERGPTVETMRGLHRAHATHIPFENLDVLLGRPIRLDLESLQAKLVRARRGGYCFEHNLLFAAALEQLGFRVTRLSARVRHGTDRILPRTHMLLLLEVDGEPWIGDVGFGGWGLLEPIPLVGDREMKQGAWTFRLRREGGGWVLQCLESNLGLDQYAFTLEGQLPVDYELANHYCSTHPQSRFVLTLTAQLPTPAARYILHNREFRTVDASGEHTEMVATNEALLGLLATRFGIVLPGGTVFRTAAGPVIDG